MSETKVDASYQHNTTQHNINRGSSCKQNTALQNRALVVSKIQLYTQSKRSTSCKQNALPYTTYGALVISKTQLNIQQNGALFVSKTQSKHNQHRALVEIKTYSAHHWMKPARSSLKLASSLKRNSFLSND